MKKIIIIYSSQNGATEKVAERMKTTLENEEKEVEIFNLNQIKNIQIEDCNLIGIGCPTYMSRPSFEMMDFLYRLEGLENRNVFTFITYGTEKGDGANWLRRKIREMGANDIGHFSSAGRNLFPGYTNRGFLFSPDSPQNDELDEAELFIKSVLSKIKNGIVSNQTEYDPKPDFIYRLERFLTNRAFVRHFYSRFFAANRKLCINCDKCIKNCPTKNISKNDKNNKLWGRNCILCMKCEISCPKKAISSPISWFIFAPFLAINIRRAVKKGIPYRKVKLSGFACEKGRG